MHWNWAAVFKAADNQRSDWLDICKALVSWIISHFLLYNMKTWCHSSMKTPSSGRVSGFSGVKSCVLMHRRVYCFVIVKSMLGCFMFRSLLPSICHDFIWNRANAAQSRFNMRAVAEFALIFQFNKLMKKNHSKCVTWTWNCVSVVLN